MSSVFVLDTNKRPLDPVHPGRARLLLSSGKAAVFKRYPFTIILKREVVSPVLEPLRLKIDPGSKTTGLALAPSLESRAKGGSNRVSNLCLACEPCNVKKGTQDIGIFLAHKPEVLARILT